MTTRIRLESEAQAFADANAKSPFLFELGAERGRAVLDEVQSNAVNLPSVDIEDKTIQTWKGCKVSIRILRPQNAPAALPVIVFVHGAGWVFGDKLTHDRLIRELAVGTQAVIVFPNYSRSPEAKYPTAIEESYAVTKWVADHGQENGFDVERIAIAGDSVGGNMAAAITVMAKERGGPVIGHQLLFYQVTNAAFDTASYHQFAEGYHLRRDAMQWFWDQYTTNLVERDQITASPLRASIEQLKGLPPALVITAKADVLRDEGEAYANNLREADVPVTAVCFLGTIHDFVMLNALAGTRATRGAMSLAIAWLREAFAATPEYETL